MNFGKEDDMNKGRKSKGKKFTRDDFELTILAIPTIIWYVLFAYLPMFGVIIAFKNYRLTPGKGFIQSLLLSDWIGFKNFKFLFATRDAFIMIKNTLLYNSVFIILGVIIPVTLAIMMSQLYNQKLAKGFQTAILLPHFLSWVVIGYFIFSFLSYDKGLINKMMISFGKEPLQWYVEPKYWPFILVLVNLWKNIGYGMVVYLASISGIDSTYYEAAVIDGATKWQQITKITVPLIKPIVVIMFILAVGRIFNSDFGLFYIVPRNTGQLLEATTTIDTYVYKALMSLGNIGMSSAAAFFQSVFGCITIITANTITKKIDEENALF